MPRGKERQAITVLRRVPAKLVFDTADYPLRAGIRRRDITTRHQIYRGEELCLDLRVEREPSGRAALIGQLADLDRPLGSCPDLPVFLQSAGELLARGVTNEWGEFQLEYEPRSPMTLYVALRGERLLELRVDRRTTRRGNEPAKVACWA